MKTILLLTFALSLRLYAAEEARHDMREHCRAEVSGTLLSAYNDVDYLRGLIAQSEQKVKDSKARREMLDLRYHQLKTNTKDPIPAFDMDEQVLALRFEIETLRDQIREAEQHVAENQKELNQREAFRKSFEALVTPVFQIVRKKDSPPGAYDFRLEYRHACGPYELLCPLPRDQAARLKAIAEKLARPQWCERYAQLMPP
ncbi:MAG TPA: hypothetical protein VFO10_02105 [Oligoflexus sp.]|uniref:hypothetical protein n=1 Tax=Oligoflexus sp. TaxID=1971216 RepID=UPI002D7F03BA|nr:hypothetical protein [Oligoflexus sp.]HET9236012.1 hypothetical protein [Oligoflexus sp.]